MNLLFCETLSVAMTQQPSGGGEMDPATLPRSRPLVLPEVYSGEGDFDDWISHFESVSAVNGWMDGDKLLWIQLRLTGKVHLVYTRFSLQSKVLFVNALSLIASVNFIKSSLRAARNKPRRIGQISVMI